MDYYIDVWKKYAVFSGRARRREYWYFQLFTFVVNFAVGLVCGVFNAIGQNATVPFAVFSVLYTIAAIVPNLAVSVRRLHDTNRSGWFLLLGLIPAVGAVILVVMFCLPGTDGPNRFGDDPRQNEAPIATAPAM